MNPTYIINIASIGLIFLIVYTVGAMYIVPMNELGLRTFHENAIAFMMLTALYVIKFYIYILIGKTIIWALKPAGIDVKKYCKEFLIKEILERPNLILNNYDKVDWQGELLKIGLAHFDYGEGTPRLSFLKNKTFRLSFWVDFKNKKLVDKNFLGSTFELSDEELEKISNKYYWFKK